MEINKIINISNLLYGLNWDLEKNNQAGIVFLPPKVLKLPKDYKLYLQKSYSEFEESKYNEIIKTLSLIYNISESNLNYLIENDDMSKYTNALIANKIKSIQNTYNKIKFYKGSSLLFPDSYAIITFNELETEYLYEYFVFFYYKNDYKMRSMRVKFAKDVMVFINQDPKLFSFRDAIEGCKAAIYLIMSEVIEKEIINNEYNQILDATKFQEVQDKDVLFRLQYNNEPFRLLKKTTSSELKNIIDKYEKIEPIVYEEIKT